MKIREMSLLPDARADLLCYLVATAAATYALTSDWRVDLIGDLLPLVAFAQPAESAVA